MYIKNCYRDFRKYFPIFLVFVFLGACQSPKYAISNLDRELGQPKLIIMPLDVELYEISVGGVLELKPEWTRNGKKNLEIALKNNLKNSKNIIPIMYIPEDKTKESYIQLMRLFNAVGQSIFWHYYIAPNALPAKTELDWSLGDITSQIQSEYDADYALFLTMKDHFSSGGRIALGVVTTLLIGYVPGTGLQQGIAYLVDLSSGKVVWFNFLQKGNFGDIRESDSSQVAVNALLSEFPK